MDLYSRAQTRIKMLGGSFNSDDITMVCFEKSIQQIRDFCNINEIPKETEVYAAEWLAADYLTETEGYSKQWERIRAEAEIGLIRFRRMRW